MSQPGRSHRDGNRKSRGLRLDRTRKTPPAKDLTGPEGLDRTQKRKASATDEPKPSQRYRSNHRPGPRLFSVILIVMHHHFFAFARGDVPVLVLLHGLVLAHRVVLCGRALGLATVASGAPAIAAATTARIILRIVLLLCRTTYQLNASKPAVFTEQNDGDCDGTQRCALASSSSRSASCLSCQERASAAAFAQVGV